MPNTKHKILNTVIKRPWRWITKTRRRKILSSILALLILLTSIRFTFFMPKGVEAGWSPNHTSWSKRKQLTLINNSSGNLSQYTTVAVTIDTKTLYDQGKIQADCDDLRVVYQPNATTYTELTRSVSYSGGETCATSQASKVYFTLQAALNSSATSTLYYIYYDNEQASAPTSPDNAYDINTIDAQLVCSFDGSTTCAAGETPSTASGAIRYPGSKSALSVGTVGDNDYVSVGDSTSIDNISSQITIEAWVKPFNNPESAPLDGTTWQSAYIFGRSFTQTTPCSSTVPDGLSQHYTGFYFQLVLNSCAYSTDAGNAPYNLGQLYHVAGTYDGQNIRIFVDGVLKETVAASGSISNNNNTWKIRGGDPNNVVGTDAIIDEVRISNVARYTSNFTPQTNPFVRDEHTVALYHFDENGDDPRNTGKAIDDSGNANHGTINGATKHVASLVGADGSSTSSPQYQSYTSGGNTYAGHEGIYVEEGTTNKITNPSFENATYNLNWTASGGTASDNTTTPLYKFGSHSYKLVLASATNQTVLISINAGNTNTHTLSAYVYRGTPANFGGSVGSTVAQLVFNGTAQTTTYTDVGGGWWRLTYSGAGIASAQNFGIQVNEDSGTLYIDGAQLEEKAYATTYADGSLGTGYSWTGTANNSTSNRTIEELQYATSGNITATAGTISFWFKPNWNSSTIDTHYLFNTPRTGGSGNNKIELLYYGPSGDFAFVLANSSSVDQGTSFAPTITKDNWYHVVATWSSGSNSVLYWNGTSQNTGNTGTPSTLANDFCIGSYVNDDTDTCAYDPGTLADATISDFRIYNNAVTSTQAADLYYAGLTAHSEGFEVDRFSNSKGQNPVAIYHFDESSGTTASDSSVYGNNLTLYGPAWETQSVGAQARLLRNLKFDGTNDIASRSAGLSKNFNFATDPFTISGWFRHPSSVSGTDTLVAKHDTAGYKVYMNSSGYLCFGIDDDSTFNDDIACSGGSPGSLADSKWHHFEAVRDSTTLTLYVDGNPVATDSTLAATGTLNNNSGIFIGADSNNSNYWDGFIDELIFYPYARSASQVKEDIAGGQTSQVYGTQAEDPLTEGLVGYWKMDEPALNGCSGGEDSCDISGNGIHGIWEATMDTTNMVGGKYGTSVDFDGSADYINISNSKLQNLSQATISAWIYPHTAGQSSTGTIYIGDPSNTAIQFRLNSSDVTNGIQFGRAYSTTSISSISTSNSITLNQWQHVVATWNGGSDASQDIRIFVNGKEVYYYSQTDGDGNLVNETQTQRIGIKNATGTTRAFDGLIDEVRIYNRSLSPAEVSQLYVWAPGPIAHYKLDEGAGTSSVNDSSGNGYIGTMIDFAENQWTTGKHGSGLIFDKGDHDNSRVITTGSNINNPKSITAEAWIKRTATPTATSVIFAQYGGSTGWGSGWRMYINNGNYIIFETNIDNVNDGYEGCAGCGNTTVLDNNWHHVAGTYDGTTTSLYVDGVLQASDTAASGDIYYRYSDTLKLGQYADSPPSDHWLPAIMDDVRVYNYARTPSQIVEDMNAGHPAPGSPVGSAIAHWKLDEGYGDTINNIGTGGSTYNGDLGASGQTCPAAGTVPCPTWSNDGKFAKALDFDGTDDYVQINNGETLDWGTGDFTYSVWVKTTQDCTGNKVWFGQREGAGDPTIWIGCTNSGGVQVPRMDVDSSTTSLTAMTGTRNIGDGNWHHVVGVKSGHSSATRSIYVDGVLDVSQNVSYTGTFDFTTTTNASIGRFNVSPFYYADALIDDVELFSSALTPDQVKVLYNQGSAAVWGASSTNSTGNATWSAANEYCPPGQGSSCTPPVVVWNLDENTGTTSTFDTSGNGYTGSLQGSMAESDWMPGRFGSALHFDQSNDYVKNSNRVISAYPFTLEAWVNTLGSVNGTIIALTDSTTASVTYRLQTHDATNFARFRLSDGTNTSGAGGTTNIDDQKWHYIVGVFDSSTIKLYVDGNLEQNLSHTVTYTSGVNTVSIGAEDHTTDETFYGGLIDNVRVYNYARTPAQIAWDYNRGAPFAYYKLDECSGSTANNAAPAASGTDSGLDGTITIGGTGGNTSLGSCGVVDTATAWYNGKTGKRNTSIDLDGSNDYVEVAENDSMDMLDGQDFSLEAWIKRDSINTDDLVLGKRTSSSAANAGYLLNIDGTTNVAQFEISDGTDEFAVVGQTALASGTWYHIVVVYDDDSTGNSTVYINGKDDKATTAGVIGNVGDISNAVAFRLGATAGNNAPFDGKIDNVRLYKYVLTSKQVQSLYNEGSMFFGPAEGSPQ